MLSDFVALGWTFIDGDEEVLYFLVVDFHHGDHDFILLVLVVVGCDAVEDFLASDRHDTLNGRCRTLLVP